MVRVPRNLIVWPGPFLLYLGLSALVGIIFAGLALAFTPATPLVAFLVWIAAAALTLRSIRR